MARKKLSRNKIAMDKSLDWCLLKYNIDPEENKKTLKEIFEERKRCLKIKK